MTAKKIPFKDLVNYIKTYQAYIGKRIYLASLLSFIAAITEGVGFLMILPLLGIFDSDITNLSSNTSQILDILYALGWNGSKLGLVAIVIILFVAKGGLIYAATLYTSYLSVIFVKRQKTRVVKALNKVSYSYFTSKDTGHFTNIVTKQTDLSMFSFKSLIRALSEMVMSIAYISLAFYVSWRFGLTALVIGGLFMMLFSIINAYVRRLSRQSASISSDLSQYLIQFVQGFKYILTTSQSKSVLNHFFASVNNFVDYEYKRRALEAVTYSIREPLLITIVMCIIAIQVIVFEEKISPIIISLAFLYRALNAIHSVQLFLQLVFDNIGALEIVEKELGLLKSNREDNGTSRLPTFDSSIVFSKVSFAFSDENYILNDLSLKIESKKSYAIVGHSGAGKSTLVDLISLIHRPTLGRIIIDGHNSDSIDNQSWRSMIGFVSQDLVIFNDSIANNITMWGVKNMKDIEQAARDAYLHEDILKLPDGYNTIVGDRGISLSGGQKQRLFIARELYRQPKILILDEATSALDSVSEKYIQESITQLSNKLTTIIIAHRLSTIKHVDHVFVLDRGKLIESDSYNSLASKQSSMLYSLIHNQR
jgi:subfamily B ATP-binding cassette protein MsbA